MVINDSTVSLEQHLRRITIEDGPTLNTKKSKLGKKHAFKVTSLTVLSYADLDPEHVTARGIYTDKKGRVINCHRVYTVDEAPRWMKALING